MNRIGDAGIPDAYLITFTTYGTHLPGAEHGWVNHRRNCFGMPYDPRRPGLERSSERAMAESCYGLEAGARDVVLATIEEVCIFRCWDLMAAHVRTKHVHAVVAASAQPESVMNAFKAYGSRKLNSAGFEPGRKRRWTRHGSTEYLWTDEETRRAIEYVIEGQGKPMAVYPRKRA